MIETCGKKAAEEIFNIPYGSAGCQVLAQRWRGKREGGG